MLQTVERRSYERSIETWSAVWITANAFDILLTGIGLFVLDQRELNPWAGVYSMALVLIFKIVIAVLLPITSFGIVYFVDRFRRPIPDFDIAVRNLIRIAAILIWLAVGWNAIQIFIEI